MPFVVFVVKGLFMRTPFIAGNWKMYKTVAETVKYVKEFRSLVKDFTGVEIVVAPPFSVRRCREPEKPG